jgi:hypothetical protein
MSTLIDGKHPKQIVIEYYDDLIARVDVYAEEMLEKIKDDEVMKCEEDSILTKVSIFSNFHFMRENTAFKEIKSIQTVQNTVLVLIHDFT